MFRQNLRVYRTVDNFIHITHTVTSIFFQYIHKLITNYPRKSVDKGVVVLIQAICYIIYSKVNYQYITSCLDLELHSQKYGGELIRE